jgi:F0F1-type ATP synthase membrane subunit b/b'
VAFGDGRLVYDWRNVRRHEFRSTHRILENSERDIEAAVRQARNQLRAFAANLAVSLAQQSMLIDEKTGRDLIGAFVTELKRGKKIV